MERLLLYVHYNKFNFISGHVLYQLEKIRPLYSRVVFISNSQLPEDVKDHLSNQHLVDDILERQNSGFDFAAWRDGMKTVGFDQLAHFDSVTLMNDTCFGPLWDLEPIYERFENENEVDFWGMTNYRKNKDFNEHIQSYYLSFKKANNISVAPLSQERLRLVFSEILFPKKQPVNIAIIFIISEKIIISVKFTVTKPVPNPAARPSRDKAMARDKDSLGESIKEWSTSAAVLSIQTFKKNLKSDNSNW